MSHFTCIDRRKKPFLFVLSISMPISNTVIFSGLLPYLVWLILPLIQQILLIFWIVLLYQGETVQKISAAALLLTVSSLFENFAGSFPTCLILIPARNAYRTHSSDRLCFRVHELLYRDCLYYMGHSPFDKTYDRFLCQPDASMVHHAVRSPVRNRNSMVFDLHWRLLTCISPTHDINQSL